MRIAVDAMGGDYAPEAIVEGAVQAAEEYGTSIILVGPEDLVHKELEKYDTTHLEIEVKHASQVVAMQDLPSVALRRKKDSSLHVAINLIPQGYVDAAVSAGNTGAAMAISTLACRTLEGIERPALATVMPNINGATVIIDVGANVDCKPIHLLQFAVMGHVYAQEVLGIENPRIGLLSTGEESSKGNVLTKEVFEPLSKTTLNFIGNAEGRDVFNGRVDVVVCDGFTGNVVLKASESLAETVGLLLKEGFAKNWRTKLGYLLAKPALAHFKKRTDYDEYGGAPLLGLNGIVIISHGSSKAKALKNAIRVAGESVNHQIQEKIVETLKRCEFDVKARKRATSLWRQLFKESLRHESDKGKTLVEKHEDLEQQDHVQESAAEADQLRELTPEPEKPQDLEREKRVWWSLKDLTHRERSRSEQQEEPEKQAPTPEPELMTPPEQQQELALEEETPVAEPEHKKRGWWSLKGTRLRERSRSEPQEEVEEKPADEPESEIEPEHKPAPDFYPKNL